MKYNSDDVLLSPRDVCKWLDVSMSTLANWRRDRPSELPFVRLVQGVRYRKGDVEAFLDRRTVGSGE